LLDDHRLADVEHPQRPRDPFAPRDVRQRLVVGADAAKRALRRQARLQHLVGADHPKPLALQFGDDRRQQPVVAKRAIADAGEEFGGAPIGAQ